MSVLSLPGFGDGLNAIDGGPHLLAEIKKSKWLTLADNDGVGDMFASHRHVVSSLM